MKERRKSHTRMIGFIHQIKKGMAQVEKVLAEPVPARTAVPTESARSAGPATMRGAGRVIYVARAKKADVSARAQQMLSVIHQKGGRATAPEVMSALGVNRNVIAGAVHELKQAGVVETRSQAPAPVQVAAGQRPRTRKRNAKRSKTTR